MEGVEAALLAHVCCPRFAAIEKGAQHTGLVDSHLGVLSEHLIFPYSFGLLGHSDAWPSSEGNSAWQRPHTLICLKSSLLL